jgi:hypothetical protein
MLTSILLEFVATLLSLEPARRLQIQPGDLMAARLERAFDGQIGGVPLPTELGVVVAVEDGARHMLSAEAA